MSKILITGANGQLGMTLRDVASQMPQYDFIFTDYQELDITSFEQVDCFFKRVKPDFVVNCAAYTAVDQSENEPAKAELLNSTAVAYLARSAKEIDAVLIHISTDYVFDGRSDRAIGEDHPTAPIGVYGRTKLMGEKPVLNYHKGIVIRTAWLYSEYGANFVKTMLRLGATKERISVVSDQVGSPTHALDLARTIVKVISTIETKGDHPDFYGVFHYSNSGECSWCDFARAIMQIANLKCEVTAIASSEYPSIVERPKYSLLSKDKIKRIYDVEVPDWLLSLNLCKLF